jgi:hypothetical protein
MIMTNVRLGGRGAEGVQAAVLPGTQHPSLSQHTVLRLVVKFFPEQRAAAGSDISAGTSCLFVQQGQSMP